MRSGKKEITITENAKKVLTKRYLAKDKEGKVIETPAEMFGRVAKNIAQADKLYQKGANTRKTENEFYNVMTNLEFLPNSPTGVPG